MTLTRRKQNDSYEDTIREMEEARKDPKKWQEYFVSRANRVLDNWPRRSKRKPMRSVKSS